MQTAIFYILSIMLLLACKPSSTLTIPPDNELSFLLVTPDEGEVLITSHQVERFRFHNTQHPVDDPSGRSLVMYVDYAQVVSETGNDSDVSLMFRLHEPDAHLFGPSANGNFDMYTDPQDFFQRFLAPQPLDDKRHFELSVAYDQQHLVGWVDATSVRVTLAEWQETTEGDIQIQVAGFFALPLTYWYAFPGQDLFSVKEGQFRFTIPLKEIY